ncbi:hypothetical protein ATJ97_1673 [Georgenia soli]|uniref:Uncharacterized protein n=1 Tax=Georgenia soli TaxID=638953 RepID=A0A2A9EJU7_9MICO|nr:hypothetical protein [Georgenia soli]PFG39178.1 hypothetical protein ATJ97_1673 [Georgenia soli]
MAEQPGGPVPDHPEPDEIVTLALGEVHEPGRSELARHLAACEPCREEYSAVVAGLEQVLAAAPTVAPPPGFEGRVLTAMGMAGAPAAAGAREHPRDAGRSGVGPSRSGVRRRAVLVAAAAGVAGLAVGAGGAFLVTQDAGGPGTGPAAPPPSAGAPYTGADLVRADGAVVGRVSGSRFGGRDVLVVDVVGAPEGVRYECRGVMPDGTEVPLGAWTVGPERSATWVVTDPGVTAVRLVTGDGRAWADAAL